MSYVKSKSNQNTKKSMTIVNVYNKSMIYIFEWAREGNPCIDAL